LDSQGLRNGRGDFKTPYYQYWGDFEHDEMTGFAEIVWRDGAKFDGRVKDGKLAQGKFVLSHDTYEGNYVDGKLTGTGKITS
jgi:hypothetical protein